MIFGVCFRARALCVNGMQRSLGLFEEKKKTIQEKNNILYILTSLSLMTLVFNSLPVTVCFFSLLLSLHSLSRFT